MTTPDGQAPQGSLAPGMRPPTADDRREAAGRVHRKYRPAMIDWREAWQRAPRETDWIVPDFIERGTIAMLYGRSDVGKSLLTLSWCARLAAVGVRVLWLDFEDREQDFVTRLEAMGWTAPDLYDEDGRLKLVVAAFPALPPLDTDQGGRDVLDMALAYDPQLVVVNSLSRVIEGPEDKADTYIQLYRRTGIPLRQRGITVLATDHEGKDESRGQRGSSAKANFADTVWHMKRAGTGTARTLARERGRQHGGDMIHLRLTSRPLGFERYEPAAPDTVDRREAAARALAIRLNSLGIPREWGRPKVKAALAEAGVAVRNEVLAEAIRLRRTVPGDSAGTAGDRGQASVPLSCPPRVPIGDSGTAGQPRILVR